MWIITNCGKLLKRWEYQTILPVSWEPCMQVKKQQLESCMEQLIGLRLRKENDRAEHCHPVCLTYILSTSWEMLDWMSYKLDSRWGEKHQQPQTCRWYHSSGRKWRGTQESLDEGEGREWKSWLKIKYKKTKILASGPTTSWQIEEEKVEVVTDFLFLGSKVTADGDCSHEIRRRLLLDRKAMTNLDMALKAETLLCQQRSI